MLYYIIIIINSYNIYIYSKATQADTKELKRAYGTIRINRVDSFNHLRLQIDINKHRIRHYKTVIEPRHTSNQHERTMRCTEEIREKNIHELILIGLRKTGEGSGLLQKKKLKHYNRRNKKKIKVLLAHIQTIGNKTITRDTRHDVDTK